MNIAYINTNQSALSTAASITANKSINKLSTGKAVAQTGDTTIPLPTQTSPTCSLSNVSNTGTTSFQTQLGQIIKKNGNNLTLFGKTVTDMEALNPHVFALTCTYTSTTDTWEVTKDANSQMGSNVVCYQAGIDINILSGTTVNGVAVVLESDGKIYPFDNDKPDHIFRYVGILLMSVEQDDVAFIMKPFNGVVFDNGVFVNGTEYYVGANGVLITEAAFDALVVVPAVKFCAGLGTGTNSIYVNDKQKLTDGTMDSLDIVEVHTTGADIPANTEITLPTLPHTPKTSQLILVNTSNQLLQKIDTSVSLNEGYSISGAVIKVRFAETIIKATDIFQIIYKY